MSDVKKVNRRGRTGDHETRADEDVMSSAEEGAEPGTKAYEDEVKLDFAKSLVRLADVIRRHLVDARLGVAESVWTPDIKERIEELKSSNVAIRKVERLLSDLKKLQNQELEDLRDLEKMFDPKRRSEWPDD